MSACFETCSDCGGSGTVREFDVPYSDSLVVESSCPSCVEGVVITDELVEAVTRDWWDEADALDEYEALDADGRANARADIEIVLASAIRHMKGTQ